LFVVLALPGEGGEATTAAVFAQLYEEFMPKVFRYVSYKIASRSTAEDLTSAVFEKALGGFTHFRADKASFSTWIFTIARNTLIDYFRAHRNMQSLEAEDAPDVPDGRDSPEEDAIKNEEILRLRHCMELLNRGEREIVSLKFAGEITNRAIARQVGFSESNVGVILFRAVRKLRECVEGSSG
jgi:RNA polymerase sigma-70 factor (ECF subfamily)